MESWRRRGEGRGGEGAGMRRLLSREQQADRWISRDFVVVIDTRARSRASLSLSWRMNLHGVQTCIHAVYLHEPR